MKGIMNMNAKTWFSSALVISDLYSSSSLASIRLGTDNFGLKHLKKLCIIIHLKGEMPINLLIFSLFIKFSFDSFRL